MCLIRGSPFGGATKYIHKECCRDKRVHEWNKVAIKGSKDGHFNKAPTITESVELENEAAPAQSTTNQVVVSIGEASSAGKVATIAEATIVDVDDGLPILASDHSIKNSSDSDHQDLFVEDDGEFKSDVHKDDISSDEYSMKSDLEDGLGKIDSRKIADAVTKCALQEGVQLEKYINESKKDSVGPSGVVVGPSDIPSTTRPRERPKNTPTTTDAPPRPRGRLRKTSDNPEYSCSIKSICFAVHAPRNPPASPVHAPPNSPASPIDSQFSTCNRRAADKRPKTVEIGILFAENGFTTYIIRLPNSMILHTGSTQPIRSVDITGDLGYKSKIGGK
ncbi:hypothetical protein FXO37_27064 [Capsicum annuum]|nr:hypothetical protein FXO37_27064 [Capsicum annuum]